ncbi:MAG: hypothetical protein LIP23_00260, partial [Planctomycetes bacterium]|nr:hypothetical protein [Planctomycetota bacterium]
DAGVEGKGGLELFYDLRDPGNTRNFLDFFDMDNDGSLRFTARPSFRHSHFISSFRRCAIIDLFKSYLILRRQLMDFVKLKEKNALARSGGKGKKNLFPIDAFNRKRPRQ